MSNLLKIADYTKEANMKNRISANQTRPLEICKGDLVDFGAYGKFYVSDPYSYKNLLWITPDENDRYNENSAGRSIPRELAKEILND